MRAPIAGARAVANVLHRVARRYELRYQLAASKAAIRRRSLNAQQQRSAPQVAASVIQRAVLAWLSRLRLVRQKRKSDGAAMRAAFQFTVDGYD